MKILECSSAGDKRFSALYATVNFLGITKTIEEHYQQCKRDELNQQVSKGQTVHHIIIQNKILPPELLTPFYRYLWHLYFKQNPHLISFVKQFDVFTDKFRGKAINCQADCIKAVATNNVKYFREAYNTLSKALKEKQT